MKLKTIFLLTVMTLALAACVAQPIATSNAVQLPDALKIALNALILAGITAGLQVVFERVGLDLRGYGVGLAAAVGEFAILQMQGLIDVVPAQYDTAVGIVLNVIVVILSGLGYIRLIAQRERAAAMLKVPNKFM